MEKVKSYLVKTPVLILAMTVLFSMGWINFSAANAASKAPEKIDSKTIKLVKVTDHSMKIKFGESKYANLYYLAYRDCKKKNRTWTWLQASDPEITVKNLKKNRKYCIKVMGSNMVSYGPWSKLVHFTAGKLYKLSFNANGGKKVKTVRKLRKGQKYGKLPVAKMTKKGYTVKFKGWYTKKNGGKKAGAGTKMGPKSTVLYAHWNIKANKANKGDLIKLSDRKYYRVIKQYGGKKVLVVSLSKKINGKMYDFHDGAYETVKAEGYNWDPYNPDRDYSVKYAGSQVDKLLNGSYYNKLSFKKAIVEQNIDQSIYAFGLKGTAVPAGKKKIDLANGAFAAKVGKVGIGKRKVFVLDLDDVFEYTGGVYSKSKVDRMLNRKYFEDRDWYNFRSGATLDGWAPDIWNYSYFGDGLCANDSYCDKGYVRPAFVVDLAKTSFSIEDE